MSQDLSSATLPAVASGAQPPEVLLAVDGGGSKTHVVSTDLAGKVLGEGYSGPTSLAATSVGAAGYNLKEAVRQALESFSTPPQIRVLSMGLAGMDTPTEEATAHKVFTDVLSDMPIGQFILVNDSVIALEGGTDAADAIALIAGTGSNCFGRNKAGQTAKASGMDYLLTDQGSGYAIGRAVLRHAVRSFDGRVQKSVLEQLVCEHFRIESIAELKAKVYNPPLTKTEIAELTQLCLRAADDGDVVAQAIFTKVVADLIEISTAVIHRLHLETSPATLILAGSITKLIQVQQPFQKDMAARFPQLEISVPEHPPVFGAIKLAQRHLKTSH